MQYSLINATQGAQRQFVLISSASNDETANFWYVRNFDKIDFND